jgi:tetratricopeptide (TPR) repeat protein
LSRSDATRARTVRNLSLRFFWTTLKNPIVVKSHINLLLNVGQLKTRLDGNTRADEALREPSRPVISHHAEMDMIKPLELQDKRHLEAAQGWIELGNHLEANEELENITPKNRAHLAVLEVGWQIHAKAKKWEAALDIASALVHSVPEHLLGWVHRSYCLHELKRTEEVRDNLLRVVDKFLDDPIMRYNLACYEYQLGRLEQAKNWLEKAFAVGDSKKIKLMALNDPDLEPLWKEIGRI